MNNTYNDLLRNIKDLLKVSVNRNNYLSIDIFQIKFLMDMGTLKNGRCNCSHKYKYLSKNQFNKEIELFISSYRHREDFNKSINKILSVNYIKDIDILKTQPNVK